MRGLKRKGIERILPETKVASFTDAWIETYQHDFMRKMEKSHLLQMRGLKQQIIWDNDAYIGRIFYRCVDWNIVPDLDLMGNDVASFTDAWIETELHAASRGRILVASFTDAWIETYQRESMPGYLRRIFYRCVDWNIDWVLSG